MSESFEIQSFRDGETKYVRYCRAKIVEERKIEPTDQPNGTQVTFFADKDIFGNYHYIAEYLEAMVKNYVFLNTGLTIFFNDHKYYSKRGLYDLLMENMSGEGLYPIIHLKGEDIEMAMTHGRQYGEEYYSFVNGQHTTQGGTHLSAFREAVAKTIRDFYKKDFEISDTVLLLSGRQYKSTGTGVRVADEDETGFERYKARPVLPYVTLSWIS